MPITDSDVKRARGALFGSRDAPPPADLRDVTIIVGAGISYGAADVPLWLQLMQSCCDFAAEERPNLVQTRIADIREQLGHDPLGAADQLRSPRILNEAQFSDFLRHSFEHHDAGARRDRSRVYESLEQLKPRLARIATLNYDKLLEAGLGSHHYIDWANPQIMDFFNKPTSHQNTVLHIHGVWNIPRNVVWSERDYEQMSGGSTDESRAARDCMRRLVTWGHMLFIGCGGTMQDPHFARLFAYLDSLGVGSAGGQRHVLLCHADQARRMDFLPRGQNLNDTVAVISHGDFAEIPLAIYRIFGISPPAPAPAAGTNTGPSDAPSGRKSDLGQSPGGEQSLGGGQRPGGEQNPAGGQSPAGRQIQGGEQSSGEGHGLGEGHSPGGEQRPEGSRRPDVQSPDVTGLRLDPPELDPSAPPPVSVPPDRDPPSRTLVIGSHPPQYNQNPPRPTQPWTDKVGFNYLKTVYTSASLLGWSSGMIKPKFPPGVTNAVLTVEMNHRSVNTALYFHRDWFVSHHDMLVTLLVPKTVMATSGIRPESPGKLSGVNLWGSHTYTSHLLMDPYGCLEWRRGPSCSSAPFKPFGPDVVYTPQGIGEKSGEVITIYVKSEARGAIVIKKEIPTSESHWDLVWCRAAGDIYVLP